MNSRSALALVLGLAAMGGVVACSSDDANTASPEIGPTGDETATDEDAGAGETTPDTTSPTILSVTPTDGTKKLKDDVKIIFTFSEPMAKAATEGAFVIDASSKTSAPPTMTWNEDGTVLTIDPKAAYATGTDPAAVTAVPLRFAISTGATDLAGNALTAGASASVSLYRQITLVAPRHDTLFGNTDADKNTRFSFIGAGDNSGNVETRGYVSYVLPSIPAGVEISRATLEGTIRAIDGAPFALFGDMQIEHMAFDRIDSTTHDAPSLRSLGIFIPATPAPKVDDPVAKDVLLAVRDDYAMGRLLSQYRLRFVANVPSTNDTKDFAHIKNAGAETKLSLAYLIE